MLVSTFRLPSIISSYVNEPPPSTFKSPVIVMSTLMVQPEAILAAVVVIKAIVSP